MSDVMCKLKLAKYTKEELKEFKEDGVLTEEEILNELDRRDGLQQLAIRGVHLVGFYNKPWFEEIE